MRDDDPASAAAVGQLATSIPSWYLEPPKWTYPPHALTAVTCLDLPSAWKWVKIGVYIYTQELAVWCKHSELHKWHYSSSLICPNPIATRGRYISPKEHNTWYAKQIPSFKHIRMEYHQLHLIPIEWINIYVYPQVQSIQETHIYIYVYVCSLLSLFSGTSPIDNHHHFGKLNQSHEISNNPNGIYPLKQSWIA